MMRCTRCKKLLFVNSINGYCKDCASIIVAGNDGFNASAFSHDESVKDVYGKVRVF